MGEKIIQLESINPVDLYGINDNKLELVKKSFPKLKIIARGDSDYSINAIQKTYSEVSEGEIAGLFNSSGLLEIAINKGSTARLLGMKLREIIRIDFDD